jgi:hypothetical protein
MAPSIESTNDEEGNEKLGWSEVIEKLTPVNTQAYMLVYLRDHERARILERDRTDEMVPK